MGIEYGAKNLYKLYGTPTLDLTFAGKKSLVDRISGNNLFTFTRSSTATYIGADGLIKSATTNEARFDHNPTTLESLGLLIEETRTNTFTNSNPWSGGDNVTWTSGQTSPTGGTEAYKMVETTANNIHGLYILGGGFTASYNQYISVFAKSSGRRYLNFWAALGAYPGVDSPECIFDLQSGTVAYTGNDAAGMFSSTSIVSYGNGWYRCGIYLNPYALANRSLYMLMSNSSSASQSSYTGDGTSGILLFGLQLETGAFPTSYIPTTSSTVTRADDVPVISGSNFTRWFNASAGTFFCEWKSVYPVNERILNFGSGPSSTIMSNEGVLGSGLYFSSLQQAPSTTSANGIKIAVATSVSESAGAYSGNSAVSTGACSYYASASSLNFVPGAAAIRKNWIKRVIYWPTRLSNAQLQAITA